MKVTDYILEFFISKGITDIFGYPGGVICHLIDSTTKYSEKINAHINYHEQAAAFAACGYAQSSNKLGVAYTTSGPGATNLVTGIANAYFDSIPTMFLTGQVDTYALKGNLPIRQRGFQESDVVLMVSGITKYAVRVDDPNDIRFELEKAYVEAFSGNPGPVLLDLPADVQRADVDVDNLKGYLPQKEESFYSKETELVLSELKKAKRPCILVGNGVKQSGMKAVIRKIVDVLNIPTVFSMPAFDTLPKKHKLNFGFIGANGHRYGNFVLGKSDLIITIGSRLDLKQVGNNRDQFAPNAKIIRIDIDEDSFEYPVHKDEICIKADIKDFLPHLLEQLKFVEEIDEQWVDVCTQIKNRLTGYDDEEYTKLLNSLGKQLPDNITITADVGQSEVWIAQQLEVKENQSVHMSAGHGAMGYSLPAAIGAYYGAKIPVVSFNGDGGVQMNIQELQFLARTKIPVYVVVLNNKSLGMIRGFQEANFDKNYVQTIEGKGYSAPDFHKLSEAYGLQYLVIQKEEDTELLKQLGDKPALIEVVLSDETLLNPNFGRNNLIQDQRPYLDRELFEELMKL